MSVQGTLPHKRPQFSLHASQYVGQEHAAGAGDTAAPVQVFKSAARPKSIKIKWLH